MNKLVYTIAAIFTLCLFSACGGNNDDNIDTIPNTDPLKGDNISIEQLVGTYEPNRVYFDDNSTNIGFFEYKQKLTFNIDKTGYDFTYNFDHSPFIWSLSENVISFRHSKYGDVKAWMKGDKLNFKAPYGENGIAIYEYKKVN